MFGHFNDQIREYIVGMEGKGSWRSNGTVCQPKSFYQRDGLLCICDEDGNWPNPVCRDVFRVLHEVEITDQSVATAGDKCTATRLYLYGCNVCICPSSGVIDPEMCTKNNCSENDPVLDKGETKLDEGELEEVYATCVIGQKYEIGCGYCMCLKNNRLLCDKCSVDVTRVGSQTHCSRMEVNTAFFLECNVCYCNERGMVICTTKKCRNINNNYIDIPVEPEGVRSIKVVEPPISEEDCVPGTKYKVDCNTCYCSLTLDGRKVLSCTVKTCKTSMRSKIASLRSDCVADTAYEVNCLECTCTVVDGVKRETCMVDSKCNLPEMNREPRTSNFYDLHGYCEPAHIYSKDCNTCRCLSDGKTAICSSKICPKPDLPIFADIIPVSQRGGKPCPKDHMYKVDCNFCFCLRNGNVLCTTVKCDNK
ncbi:uncharacterized protein LOC126376801 [Pectinophora gossypiella]|nr:uncharacterized protein LOC126376801 [Pectinophora gossypiella]